MWRSLVACLNGVQEVGSSNLLTQTNSKVQCLLRFFVYISSIGNAGEEAPVSLATNSKSTGNIFAPSEANYKQKQRKSWYMTVILPPHRQLFKFIPANFSLTLSPVCAKSRYCVYPILCFVAHRERRPCLKFDYFPHSGS